MAGPPGPGTCHLGPPSDRDSDRELEPGPVCSGPRCPAWPAAARWIRPGPRGRVEAYAVPSNSLLMSSLFLVDPHAGIPSFPAAPRAEPHLGGGRAIAPIARRPIAGQLLAVPSRSF